MSPFKIIFVHGYTASSKADWYPDISQKLKTLHVDFEIPSLPGGQYPHAQEWLMAIHAVITKSTKPLVLVGHSLGTRAILLYLEIYQQTVEKVFLIAAFANDIQNAKRKNEHYSDFFEYKIDLSKIKPLAKKYMVLHSKDDSSIPYEQGVQIAKDLDAQLLTYTDSDHFNESDKAEIIFEVLRKEVGF